MKLYSFLSLAAISLQTVYAAEYSVIAFPNAEQTVNVVVQGQSHALTQEPDHPNIFKGTAPSAENYQYALISNAGQQVLEAKPRILQQGVESTGVEFFNRSQTVYNVPGLPQAYHPIYPRKLLNHLSHV
jgi:hypothetical protein